MTNLTQEITTNGGSLTVWKDGQAKRLLSGFSPTGPWLEFPAPENAGPGRYFGYNSDGEISAFLAMTTWEIAGNLPLENYLRNVDEFDDGKLGQRSVTWIDWSASNNVNTATVECSIGPTEADFVSHITYKWMRNILNQTDKLIIVCLNAPKSIAGNIDFSYGEHDC